MNRIRIRNFMSQKTLELDVIIRVNKSCFCLPAGLSETCEIIKFGPCKPELKAFSFQSLFWEVRETSRENSPPIWRVSFLCVVRYTSAFLRMYQQFKKLCDVYDRNNSHKSLANETESKYFKKWNNSRA